MIDYIVAIAVGVLIYIGLTKIEKEIKKRQDEWERWNRWNKGYSEK